MSKRTPEFMRVPWLHVAIWGPLHDEDAHGTGLSNAVLAVWIMYLFTKI